MDSTTALPFLFLISVKGIAEETDVQPDNEVGNHTGIGRIFLTLDQQHLAAALYLFFKNSF